MDVVRWQAYLAYTQLSSDGEKGGFSKVIPVRFCEEDWLLAVWAVQFSRSVYRILLFLFEDHVLFAKDAGVMAFLVMTLSDAFHKTGRMELRFLGAKAGQCSLETGYELVIPDSVCRVAGTMGVQLRGDNVIYDDEGRKLYLSLTGLSAGAQEILVSRGLDTAATCFAIHRGAFEASEIEAIIRYCSDTTAVLRGSLDPTEWLQYKRELLVLRLAVASERFRNLVRTSTADKGLSVHTVWVSESEQELTFSAPVRVKLFSGEERELAAAVPHRVVLFPQERSGYRYSDGQEFERLGGAICVVTKDFEWSGHSLTEKATQAANGQIVVLLDALNEIDEDIDRRLGQLASTLRPVLERPE